ncbi:MAG: hypothetical protein ACE145_03745 [Terriglobia bacterium]
MKLQVQDLETETLQEEITGGVGARQLAPAHLPPLALRTFQAGLESLNCGEAKPAAACFEQVLSLAPNFTDGHIGLGIAYAIDSRVYPALDHLEHATRLDPGNFHAHFKLGQLYFKLRVPQKGYEAAQRALACATSLSERKLVAQLLREERAREKNGVPRPWWNRGFSRSSVSLGFAILAGLLAALLLALH